MQLKPALLKQAMLVLCVLLLSYTAILQAADVKDINTATTTQLTEVKGIGTKTAAAIVAFRDEGGNIKSMDALLAVKGVGKKKLINIEELFGVLPTAKKAIVKTK